MSEKKSSLGKWIMFAAIVTAVAGAAWWWLARHDHADDPQFQTAAVSRGDLTQAVTATGTLNPVVNVTVGSQISGIIQSLNADFNSKVASNQVVAQLDPATYQAAVKMAQGDLANAKANMELNQAQETRAAELFKNKLISGSEHDIAVANLHQAQAQVQMKEATLANAEVNLARCTIYAPVDGVVISRAVDVGQTVAASLSAPTLFTIANDLTKMQIDCNVSEADVGSVEENQSVDFTVDAFPGRTFHGSVKQIRNAPTTVQNVVTYDTVVSVENPDLKLKPGMTANASIIIAHRNEVLKVANSALRFRPPDALTNKVIAASTPAPATSNSEPPLTGNEPPQELQRRVNALRERGEEVPQNIRAKMREYFQSGVLQRGGNHGGGVQPAWRTAYLLVKTPDDAQLQAVRVKVGITDGIATEIVDGLKEGDQVVTSVTLPSTAAQQPSNPFGGPQFPRR